MNFANFAMRQAECYCSEQRWDLAERVYRDAVEQDPSPMNHTVLGSFLAERQQNQPAIVELMHGLDGAQATGDLELQALIFANLAGLYRELGDSDLAQRFQRQVLSLRESAGAEELLDWSADAVLAGKVTLAELLARQAFEMAEESENVALQADACGTLGIIAAREGKQRRAVWLLIRAARGHQHVGDEHGLGVDYQNLAEVCGLLERFEWQRWFFSAAEECFERAGRPLSQAKVARRGQDADRLSLYRRMIAEQN